MVCLKIIEQFQIEQKLKLINIKLQYNSKQKQLKMPKKWDQSPNNSRQGINLEEVFENPNLNAAKLLNIQNIVEECKKQSEKFTNKLVLHPSILQDLIQICIRPAYFKHQELTQITTSHTYKALQILNNLSEQFCDYLLPSFSQQSNQNVITQQQHTDMIIDFSCPLVTQVFKILHDPKPIPETPLWYMYKINTSLCYQKPKHVIRLFKESKDLCMNLFQHFYSNSILEWLIKLLEIEDSNSFFQQEKIVIFKYFIQKLSEVDRKEQNIELKLNKLENYQVIMNTLLQKMQDRFDKTKFIKLTKCIYSQRYGIDFVVQALQLRINSYGQKQQRSQIQEQMFKKLLTLCQIYFHFGATYKKGIANSIKLNSVENLKKVDSNNNSNLGIDTQNYDTPYIQLNSSIMNNIRNGILELSKNIVKIKNNNLPTIIQFLRLLKTVLMTLEPTQYEFATNVINAQFIQFLFTQIKNNRKSNILHNLIRDIVIDSLRINYQNSIKILFNSERCSFMSMISHLRGSQNSGDYQYQNQLYHMFQVVTKIGKKQQKKQRFQQIKMKEGYQQIQQQIKQKQNLYNSLICQNPRQQTWGDEEQDQKLLTFNFNNNNYTYSYSLVTNNQNQSSINNKKNTQEQKSQSPDFISGNVQHFVQYGLPLDSDQSKDQEANMTGSDVLEKQDVITTYKPIIKLTTSGEYEKKQGQSILNLENQLAKKFKNIGVVQCQEQEIRIPVKKQRYGNKSNSNLNSNPFVYLNPNINFNFNTSPKNSPKNSPKTSPRNLFRQNSQKLKVAPKIEKQSKQKEIDKKVQQQGRDKVQMQLQRQIKILENNRMHQVNKSENDRFNNSQIQLRIKKTVDSIQEDRKIYMNFSNESRGLSQNKIIINNNVDITGMSGLMDLQSDKIQTNAILLSKQKVQNQQKSPPKYQKSQMQKNNSSLQQNQIVNMSKQKKDAELLTEKKEEQTKTQKERKESPNPKVKSRSNSANKRGGHFPTYLSYQIDQILAQLE